MQSVSIKDGSGTDFETEVSRNQTLQVGVQVPEVPPIGTPSRIRYYNALLGSAGANSGSTDMVVDGSVTPQNFYIDGEDDFDIRITSLIVTIVDGSINLSKFGALAALTIGWDLCIKEGGSTTCIIDKAKTNGEIAIQSTEAPNIYNNFSGANDGFVQIIPVHNEVLGGIRIGRGTQDRIESTVNDDLAGLVSFDVRAVGYKHYP